MSDNSRWRAWPGDQSPIPCLQYFMHHILKAIGLGCSQACHLDFSTFSRDTFVWVCYLVKFKVTQIAGIATIPIKKTDPMIPTTTNNNSKARQSKKSWKLHSFDFTWRNNAVFQTLTVKLKETHQVLFSLIENFMLYSSTSL